MADDFIRARYALESQDSIDTYYSAWASSYDAEVERQGYRTPQRCADALIPFTGLDEPILDIGCGTGLLGAALREAGFTDVNNDMLDRAKSRGVYRATWVTDVTAPFPFSVGTYAAIAAVGVIGIGAAPAGLLIRALDALASGGHLVFSFNDAAFDTPEFAGAQEQAIATGRAVEVFRERGPHFAELDSYSTVFVLRRTERPAGF